MRRAGHVARMERGEVYTGFWWGNLRERDPLGRPRRRWENNIKMDLQEFGCGSIEWIELAQDIGQVAGTYERGNEPSGSIKCGEILD